MEEVGEVREGAATVVGRASAPSYLRAPDGTIAMGALLGLADSVAGLCGGLAALPGWVVSTNLMLRAVDLAVVGPLAFRADVLRAGRNAVVTEVQVRDAGADDRLVADGVLTSAVLVPDGGPPVYERPLVLTAPPLDPATTPALADYLGTRAPDADTLAIELTEQLRNPWGILHGGVTAALVDLAGRHATGGSASHRHRAALRRAGPGRTRDPQRRAGRDPSRRRARPRGGTRRRRVRPADGDRGRDRRALTQAGASTSAASCFASTRCATLDAAAATPSTRPRQSSRRDVRLTTASIPSASAIIEIQLALPRRSPTAIAPPAPSTASRAPIIRASARAAGSPAPGP